MDNSLIGFWFVFLPIYCGIELLMAFFTAIDYGIAREPSIYHHNEAEFVADIIHLRYATTIEAERIDFAVINLKHHIKHLATHPIHNRI